MLKNTKFLMNTYARKPITFSRGEGVWLYPDNEQDERYLDALSGIAVCGLGHAHPVITKAVSEQAGQLIHTSNIYHIALQEKLGKKLCGLSGLDAAFFCNSGAEANEAAIKLARKFGHHKNIDSPKIIVMENSFHGRTMATLTATGSRKAHVGFEPLMPGFIRASYNDVDAINSILKDNTDVVAILVEPIQGEGGINIPDHGYLTSLRNICDKHDMLLMLDEVQSGNGRTGKWFCFQHEKLQPDIAVTAKGLGNGIPIGVCLAKQYIADLLAPGSHGSTFGGNPLACRAGLATIETIESEKLLQNAEILGKHMLASLDKKLSKNKYLKEVRGKGLMIGIELTIPCTQLVDICLENKLLINVTADRVIRLLPPLIIEKAHADTIVDILIKSVNNFSESVQ